MQEIFIKGPDEKKVTLYYISKSEVALLLDDSDWMEMSFSKKGSTYNNNGKYLFKFTDNEGALFDSISDIDRTINNNDFVFFKNQKDNMIYPFYFIDGNAFEMVTANHKIFNINSEYKIDSDKAVLFKVDDGRIVRIDKITGLGELYMNRKGFEIYSNFLQGGNGV